MLGAALAVALTIGSSATSFASGGDATPASHRPADPGPGQTERYVLRAGAGQTMTIEVVGTDVPLSVGVFAPDGTELSIQPNSLFSGQLPATDDYIVTVGGAANFTIDQSYSLAVSIPAGTGNPCSTTAQRIRFAPGTDHATVSGTFCSGQDSRFVLRAGAGQTMTVSGIEGGTAFSVYAPDGTQLPGGPGETISYQLPATGDYTIVTGQRRSEVSTFSFTVTIPALATSTNAQRVQFPIGTFGTSLHGSVGGNATARYVLWAGAGHRMVVQIDPAADNATLTIIAPDGTVLSSGQTGPTIESLPADGDYIVEVHPTNGHSAEYQISFWIR